MAVGWGVAVALSYGCASEGKPDEGHTGGRDGAGGSAGSGGAAGRAGGDAGVGGEAGLSAGGAGGDGVGGDGGLGGDAGSRHHPSIDELPDCDPEEPDLACIERLFLPLSDATWPFDAEHAGRAFSGNRFYVAPEWHATAVHVLEADSAFPFQCFFDGFRYATDASSPLTGPGCGSFLVHGGHPRAVECQEEGVLLAACVDQVPLNETFDIAIVAAPERSDAHFTVLAAAPRAGERVYLVGRPGFPWLDDDDQAALLPRYPLVSSGVVLAVEGEAIVVSNLAFGGSSGGVLLDTRGRALGVASTLIGHMRAQGTSVPEELAGHRTVVVGFTERMSELLEAANEP